MDEYIFWIIPDLPEKPRTYLIYRKSDRNKPVAYVAFENKAYTVSGDKNLSFTEQLNILRACDEFLQERYFPDFD